MYRFNRGVYDVIKERQMRDAGAAIHEVCSSLGVVLNQAQNYVYWKNERLGDKFNPDAASCYMSMLNALRKLHEEDQIELLVTFEVEY
jgi:hypothetical protein